MEKFIVRMARPWPTSAQKTKRSPAPSENSPFAKRQKVQSNKTMVLPNVSMCDFFKPDNDSIENPDENPSPCSYEDMKDIDNGIYSVFEDVIQASGEVRGLTGDSESTKDIGERNTILWTKGQSSIYVDAFNLALDTVLGHESHLFNEREMQIFKSWRQLGYEAQYLYAQPSLFFILPLPRYIY